MVTTTTRPLGSQLNKLGTVAIGGRMELRRGLAVLQKERPLFSGYRRYIVGQAGRQAAW
jgi:hypothetical protein